MVIPEIQRELKQLAKFVRRAIPMQPHQQVYVADRLDKLVKELTRRKQHKQGGIISNKIDVPMKARVTQMREDYPKITQAEIALRCGINSGRVSEILHGFRK